MNADIGTAVTKTHPAQNPAKAKPNTNTLAALLSVEYSTCDRSGYILPHHLTEIVSVTNFTVDFNTAYLPD